MVEGSASSPSAGIGARRIETTKVTGFGSRPRCSCRRGARLAQRQVERGALERPAAVVDRHLALGRLGEDALLLERLREGVDRVVAGEVEDGAGVLEGDVVERVVDDVLADALVAVALEVDDGGEPVEARRRELEALELVALDLQGQVGDLVIGAHVRDTTERVKGPRLRWSGEGTHLRGEGQSRVARRARLEAAGRRGGARQAARRRHLRPRPADRPRDGPVRGAVPDRPRVRRRGHRGRRRRPGLRARRPRQRPVPDLMRGVRPLPARQHGQLRAGRAHGDVRPADGDQLRRLPERLRAGPVRRRDAGQGARRDRARGRSRASRTTSPTPGGPSARSSPSAPAPRS